MHFLKSLTCSPIKRNAFNILSIFKMDVHYLGKHKALKGYEMTSF